ncbi:OprD family porin [Vibrio sp. SS-MA-C1-2]|uniref:OprD family outer membrane porin n=1 Tax=Vibrio sp. SS-MA-C1-2 TaxID=2908646 RepID=UPI001F412988|nr:OprD family outer membrane porin [Vibrio sp. SS-MA-C1-2]UJF17166.1 OprD family porin [Vibrio sp. SS-MA-C1-2]
MRIQKVKLTLISVAITSALFSYQTMAQQDPIGPEYANAATAFFNESTISGGLNFFMRDRIRAATDGGAKVPNLDHGSIYLGLGFNSGYINDVVGADVSIYGTFDMWNNASPDHEMNFWGVNNPYDWDPTDSSGCSEIEGEYAEWNSDCTDNSAAVQTAALKFKFGDNVRAKLGLFQPSVPSGVAPNWSFAAGTYTGGEIGATFNNLDLGLVLADKYRAPWIKNRYDFRTTNGEDAGMLYSLGAIYKFANNSTLDGAYSGLTDGNRSTFHLKYKTQLANGWKLSPQFYFVADDKQYEDNAFQLALITSKKFGQFTFRADGTYSSADSGDSGKVGWIAYRLTKQYGGANGPYEVSWKNSSDYNHDGEMALFSSISRDFSDLNAPGLSAGFSGAYGFGAKAEGYDELIEYAGSVFVNYDIQGGALEGAKLGLHYTSYVNSSDSPTYGAYTNAFQNQNDLIATVIIPFTVK